MFVEQNYRIVREARGCRQWNHSNLCIFTYWKLIGLCPFNLTKYGIFRFSYGGAIYSTILIGTLTLFYVHIMRYRTTYAKPYESPMSLIAAIVTKTADFIMIVMTWLSFGFRQKALRKIQILFKNIVECCDALGIHNNHCNVARKLNIQAALINFAFIITNGSFVLSSRMNINSQFNISMDWVPFSFGRIVFPNFIILFFATISAINDQFRSLNDKIQDHAKGPSMITDTKRLKRLKNHQR